MPSGLGGHGWQAASAVAQGGGGFNGLGCRVTTAVSDMVFGCGTIFDMESSEFISVIEALHRDARRRGLFFGTCEGESLRGREITLNGRSMLSFGSCSYLGLEQHPALIAGVHDAVDRFGTQFASSRGYLSMPGYDTLEDTLSQIFNAHAVVLQTTTLAHQAMFDVFLTEKDALVMDHQVHYSVQRAATLARSVGAHVESVRHEELDRAEEVVAKLARSHKTVWFTTDGITSMYGDLVPIPLLERLLDVAPNVRLYIDDAHGMSWAGEHGKGSFLSRMKPDGRVVVATSLAKAFGAGGAALIFQDPEERERVRLCGGPMVFSGPLQPPLLGAALASARLHLTDELAALQRQLADRVSYANARVIEAGLPLLVDNEVPILFIRCGLPRVACELAGRLSASGVYVNVSMYPSVPLKRSGVRVGITATHTREDIDRLVDALARHTPAVLADEGVSRGELDDLFVGTAISQKFNRPREALRSPLHRAIERHGQRASRPAPLRLECDPESLSVEQYASIRDVDAAAWDEALGGRGCLSWEAMRLAEQLFRDQPRKEHNWGFRYVMVREASGKLVAATCFTTSIQKDDSLMREEVSRAVEERRKDDPYFLSSLVTAAGSGLSEGDHLFLDRAGPWRAALTRLLAAADAFHQEAGSETLLLRDLPGDDPEMDEFMWSSGLIKLPNLDTHRLPLSWSTQEEFLAGLARKTRKMAREMLASAGPFRVRLLGHGHEGASPEEAAQLHQLYLNVARRKLRYNAFELPDDLVPHLLTSGAWELGVIHVEASDGGPADGAPVAFWAAHKSARDYAPLFCGLDYRYVASHDVYRRMYLWVLKRAVELGVGEVHLGMDAEVEKRRWGARAYSTCMYAQTRADYQGTLLRQIVEQVGVAPPLLRS